MNYFNDVALANPSPESFRPPSPGCCDYTSFSSVSSSVQTRFVASLLLSVHGDFVLFLSSFRFSFLHFLISTFIGPKDRLGASKQPTLGAIPRAAPFSKTLFSKILNISSIFEESRRMLEAPSSRGGSAELSVRDDAGLYRDRIEYEIQFERLAEVESRADARRTATSFPYLYSSEFR